MEFLAFRVENLLRSLWASICQFLYWLIAWLYDLFMNISRVEILSSDSIKPLYQRMTMVLTIIMVFYVTFEAVKYVMQPETFTDKEKGAGGLTKRAIIIVVLIAFVPNIFSWAFKFQNVIFDNQIFSKVILGTESLNSESFGRVFSSNMLGMFYYADEAVWDKEELEEEDNCEDIPCKTVVSLNLSTLAQYGDLQYLQTGLDEGDEIDEADGEVFRYYIHFDGLFAVLVGGFTVYMLVLYCIDAGVRVAQLAFLQIIAPIPIIGYLSPKKDGMFQKWTKQCVTTYLDLFIRVGIIYFVLLICQILGDAYSSGELLKNLPGNTSTTMKVFIYIALIMGLLLFAKKAPDMLKELFPRTGAATGNFGLKPGERVAPLAARTLGAGLGATRAAGGAIARGIKAAARNKENGQSIFTKRGREARQQARQDKKAARAGYLEARKDANAARKEYNRTSAHTDEGKKAEKNYEAKQQELAAKRDAYAKAKNQSYRSISGNALVGGIQGAWHGATTGAKATKLEDIPKQVKAGYKKDAESIAKYEKYLDEGGAGGITGALDRGITKVSSSIGMPTRAEGIEQTMKRYDTRIKEQKQFAAVEESMTKNLDSGIDSIKAKVVDDKHKGKVGAETDIGVKELASKLSMYELNDDGSVKVDGSGNPIADASKIAGMDYKTIRAVIAEKSDRLKQTAEELTKESIAKPDDAALAARAEKARLASAKAETDYKKEIKALSEYEVTRILQAKKAGKNLKDESFGFFDPSVTAVEATLASLKDAYSQFDTREKVEDYLKKTGRNSAEVSRLMMCFANPDLIEVQDDLDILGRALSAASDSRKSETTELENAKNRLGTGAYKDEVTANNSYTGSGNKQ